MIELPKFYFKFDAPQEQRSAVDNIDIKVQEADDKVKDGARILQKVLVNVIQYDGNEMRCEWKV